MMKSPNHSSVASKRGGSALSCPMCRPNHFDTRQATLRAGKCLPIHMSGVLSCVGDGSKVFTSACGSSHTAARQAIVTAGQSRESRRELRLTQRVGDDDERVGVVIGADFSAGEADGVGLRYATGQKLVLGRQTPCVTSGGIVTAIKAQTENRRTAALPQTPTSRRRRVVGSGGRGRCCVGKNVTPSRSV